jgi:protein SCO1/2
MRVRRALLAAIAILISTAAHGWAADEHAVQGILLKVDRTKGAITVSCDAIPGYMEAMEMPFLVRDRAALKLLAPGTTVRFKMIERDHEDYAEQLEAVRVTNYESEPTDAARLTILHHTLDPASAARIVSAGQLVPDFTLTDQAQRVTKLSQFRGKVVALTFAYSRCPNPNYCFRLSNNLSRLSHRFHDAAGRELILMTIVIDPEDDQGKALERYAATWKADPASWRFLTGKVSDIQSIAELFGMNFWNSEGFLTHSFHTAMSGHSKWATIKHKKGALDAKRGKIFHPPDQGNHHRRQGRAAAIPTAIPGCAAPSPRPRPRTCRRQHQARHPARHRRA